MSHQERPSMERRLPPEVYGIICSYACRDGGYTGWSLSLVSKYTKEISAPYRFQSISLINISEIVSFSSLLQKTPERLRRVLYLFLCDTPQATDPGWADLVDGNDSYLHRKAAANNAVVNILKLVAPTVKIIHGLFIWPHTFCLLPPLDFPALTELALYHHYRSKPTDSMVFPNLRCLRLVSCPSLHKVDFKWITQLAPGLTHLYVTAAHPLYDMVFRDFSVMVEKVLAEGLLPKDVKVFIELPDLKDCEMTAEHSMYMDHLQRIAEKFSRVTLAECQPDIGTSRDAEKQWLKIIR